MKHVNYKLLMEQLLKSAPHRDPKVVSIFKFPQDTMRKMDDEYVDSFIEQVVDFEPPEFSTQPSFSIPEPIVKALQTLTPKLRIRRAIEQLKYDDSFLVYGNVIEDLETLTEEEVGNHRNYLMYLHKLVLKKQVANQDLSDMLHQLKSLIQVKLFGEQQQESPNNDEAKTEEDTDNGCEQELSKKVHEEQLASILKALEPQLEMLTGKLKKELP